MTQQKNENITSIPNVSIKSLYILRFIYRIRSNQLRFFYYRQCKAIKIGCNLKGNATLVLVWRNLHILIKNIYFCIMRLLRRIFLPFSALYWIITLLRNLLYNAGIFKSYSFAVPVIAVGNLSTGGTGKTPQTEYLIRLLSSYYKIATLSRGYKRKSSGFVLADDHSNAVILGDEPYQFYSKFPNINVAVDADRKNGIEQLLKLRPEVILLDDAYQHRRVKAGLYILLTAYGDLYTDDFVLPAGNLREGVAGAKRADVIVVTKCPPDLSKEIQDAIVKKLGPSGKQKVFFTSIAYSNTLYSLTGEVNFKSLKNMPKVIVAGIARLEPFFNYVRTANDICKEYPDHHDFKGAEIAELSKLAQDRIIITTEKDYMRLKGKLPAEKLFYLPIESQFIKDRDVFDEVILKFIHSIHG